MAALIPSPDQLLPDAADAWRDLSDLPRDRTVLIVVEPTEKSTLFGRNVRQTYPAYIDENGRICCPGSWEPESGFEGEYWRTILWQPLPEPRIAVWRDEEPCPVAANDLLNRTLASIRDHFASDDALVGGRS